MPQLQIHLYTKFRLEGSASFNPQEGGLLPPSKHREGGLPPPLLPVPTSSLSQMSICMLSLHRVAITIRIIIRFPHLNRY